MTEPEITSQVRRVVQVFAEGWRVPSPHAWDAILHEDIDLHQPMLRCGVGLHLWHEEVARLLRFIPDVTGQVVRSATDGQTLFIEIHVSGTVGGTPVEFTSVDRLLLDNGMVVSRRSFLNPLPVMAQLLRHPHTWWPWWRSGVGPALWRRKLTG